MLTAKVVSKRKDDRIDAFWIADYMRVGHTQMPPQFEPHLMQLRELTLSCWAYRPIGTCEAPDYRCA